MTQPKPEETEPNQSAPANSRWERRRARRRAPGLFAGLMLVALGVLLFLATQGTIGWDIWWQYFLVAIGVIIIIDELAQYLGGSRSFGTGRLFTGLVLIGVGSMFLFGIFAWWPIALIAIGLIILLTAFAGRR